MDLSNENVIHIKKNRIEYLQFRKLLEYKDIVTHAYTLGTKINYRTSIKNITPLPPKEFDKAIKNYKTICESLGTDYKKIVKTDQEHTRNVAVIDKKINKDKPDINQKEYIDTDGFITNKKNLILATTNADCILFLFFDPVKKVIGNVHSGWRGTLQEISIATVEKMVKEYNCNPKDIMCFICPSIRKCHFEVEQDVMQMFYDKFKNLKQIDEIIEKKNNLNKWSIDTVLINKIILQNKGLKVENIIDSGICSVCNSDLIHSFRVEKENYGVLAALIELKEK